MADKPQRVSDMTPAQMGALITGSVFKAHIGLAALLVILVLALQVLRM